MSRELKFRAWDKKHRKYTKVLKIYFGSDGSNLGALVEDYETNYAFELQANQVEFEQSTSLKDKNGKEIYEGDIVNIQGIKYYVDFEHGGFWFSNDNRKWKAYRPFTHFQEINDAEVIGNIHENPELVGGEE